MDLNQLYHDHQLLLMRAARAGCRERSRAHRVNAIEIARHIERIHRSSGAAVLPSWRRTLAG